tara:strand:- start:743 stop:1225 length:483 start_codon:yes stop_codon:yes gene_type:complete
VTEGLILTIFGAAVGWFLNQYKVVVSENASLIKSHIVDIEGFADAAQVYWLTEPETLRDEKVLSAKLKAKHAAIAIFHGEAEKRLTIERLRQYQMLQLRLFKVSTGGSFETAGREIDPIRAIEAYEISAQLIHILRFAAKEQVSLRALLSTLYYKVTGRP